MPLSRLAFAWVPVVAWAALIFALSSIPDLGTGLGGWDLVLRKAAHLAEYAVLGALLARALCGTVAGWAWLSWVAGTAYAASDELHQSFVPGRQASALDLAIDTVGAAIGVLAVRLVHASGSRRAAPTARSRRSTGTGRAWLGG
jgi:VanZ family protein